MSNKVKILISVIDLGNYNVKVLDVETGNKIVFSSKVSREHENTPELFNWVKHEGVTVYFEKGNYSMENVKTNKEFTTQLLYSLSKIHEQQEFETKLCLLLPTQQMTTENKQKYLDLKDKEFKFDARANNITGTRNIKINDVMILPEGYVTFFALDKELQSKSILIVDIGGRTSNYCSFIKGKLEVNKTSSIGCLDFYQRIREANSAKQYDLKDMERFIEDGYVTVHKKDYIQFYNDIIEDIQSHNCILSHFDQIIFTGGGSSLLEPIKDKLSTNSRILENNIYTNVIGAGVVAKMKWGESNNGKAKE
ncbi:ParM/StbA family protein [Clostridium saccharobutylicum]|uniref:Actin-like protein N-terminal domain-containing protein n=1 Tax=Clostridium saccharobutylicum DSM 13864 TaxID=1345695 RepID=U5MTN4_CLOSA|nr:ParM/StbA family protein [Clostridium saccharobutylicum]AGX43930.1 hypothetical protein CLSA_c29630 [Clostridium saccharobutylicum DSM 13864]AQR91227.1 StbA protein [Clostridium saccharobutylicum]AQS01131.1 StbA protein [Clostridium saccharobutylicum]AQS15114.1 StbA protein [Clostridium saccharobutylicum]MBA2905240.1 plasmid segregation protein ParM [Clostridium saccharobutylicum]